MSRATLLSVAFSFMLLAPAQLFAGGPPRLCIPLAGVTAENADECAKMLTAALSDKLSTSRTAKVDVKMNEKQTYAMFYIEKVVKLSDVESALKNTKFSVPRDRLHLFGHAMLQIDAPAASLAELKSDLAELNFLTVAESKQQKETLHLMIDMPYPANPNIFYWKRTGFGDEKFDRNDFASDRTTRGEPAAKAGELPSYHALIGVATRHNARLQDISWSPNWACRLLGCVAVKR